MSLIEQAAKRLEQLKNAGFGLGEETPPAARGPASVEPTRARPPGSERSIGGLETLQRSQLAVAKPAAKPEPGVPIPGSRRIGLDLAQLAAAGMVTPDAPRSQIADEFRVIKRPLLANAQRKSAMPPANSNLIMVTKIGRAHV